MFARSRPIRTVTAAAIFSLAAVGTQLAGTSVGHAYTANCSAHPPCAPLYGGGPVETSTKNVVVLWGTSVDTTQSADVEGLLRAIGGSGYLAALSEYNTGSPAQTITSTASYGLAYTITPETSATTVDDSAIQTQLEDDVLAGHLPPAGKNTNYFVLFPNTITITSSAGTSMVNFCAYHGHAGTSTVPINYVVLPDFITNDTNAQCGPGTTKAADLESYTAHELVEAITDPDGSTGWTDANNGEIGDMCGALTGSEKLLSGTSYYVQGWYSNVAGACVFGGPNITSKPAAYTTSTSASFSFATIPSTSNAISGYKCALDGATPTACTSPKVYSGLLNGTHTFTVTSTDSTYQPSTTYHWMVDTIPPTLSVTAPGAPFQTSFLAATSYSATDNTGGSGVLSYDSRLRIAKWNGSFDDYMYPGAWQQTIARTVDVTGSPGHEYCFSTRARDRAGATSAFSTDKCAAVPLDETAMTASSGWTHPFLQYYYLGHVYQSSTVGASLTLSGAQLDRLALLVRRCSTCGSIDIYLNGTFWRTASTANSTNVYEALLVQPVLSLATRTIVLKVHSGTVYVDGIGITRN